MTSPSIPEIDPGPVNIPSATDTVNEHRFFDGLTLLPLDDTLNQVLRDHGFTHCFGVPYPWTTT